MCRGLGGRGMGGWEGGGGGGGGGGDEHEERVSLTHSELPFGLMITECESGIRPNSETTCFAEHQSFKFQQYKRRSSVL